MAQLDLSTAEYTRVQLTREQQKRIEKLYSDVAKDIAKRAAKAPRVPSDALRRVYLNELQKQVNAEIDALRFTIEGIVRENMSIAAEAVVAGNIDFMKEIGMPIQGAMSYVPAEIVERVATGQIYAGNWSLSRALWKQSVHTQRDVNEIIAKGIAENKSSYDIAKDLEKYVDPAARKDWAWSKVYPGTSKVVDYNAQRLARTMVSHAYQQAFVETTKKNPFVTKYQWVASNSDRVCEICEERDGQLYDKDSLPLDHPNGLCTYIAVIPDSMTEIADRLGDWAQGKEDPELDIWAKNLYGDGWEHQLINTDTQSNQIPSTDLWESIAQKQTNEYMKQFESSLEGLSDRQLRAIRWYSGGPYDDINKYLRLIGSGMNSEMAFRAVNSDELSIMQVERLQATMNQLRLDSPLILRRGTDIGDLAGLMGGDFSSNRQLLQSKTAEELNQMFAGTLGEYSAFLSTSRDLEGGFLGDVEVLLYAPAGTRGAAIESISRNPSEKEVLLATNTRVRVLSVESPEDSKSRIRVYMEVIPDE